MNLYDMDEDDDVCNDQNGEAVFDKGNPNPDFDRDNPINNVEDEDDIDPHEETKVETLNDIDPHVNRGQVDTGAKCSVTNLKEALHDYHEYGPQKQPITNNPGIIICYCHCISLSINSCTAVPS